MPIRFWFPVDVRHGFSYWVAFCIQSYFLAITIVAANMYDLLFYNFLLVAREQFLHLKHAAESLVELRKAFKPADTIYNMDDTMAVQPSIVSTLSGFGSSGMEVTNKMELKKKKPKLVTNAINYWVERHNLIKE